MLRKLILTVALAALYKGEPPQLGGSLFTIFCFLMGHLLLKPYLNQGLNVFQRTSVSLCLCVFPLRLELPLSADCTLACLLSLRVIGADCLRGTGLALVSQFLTVFGSVMFVVQEAVAKNNAATEDLNGKRMISFLIIFANAAAGGLYPLYRFVTAWAECGDIDFNFITSSIKSGAEKCLGPEVVASLLASCVCLSKAKDKADEAEGEVRRLRATADGGLVSTVEGRYKDATEAKKQIDEARALHKDVKSGVADARSAGADLRAEANTVRASSSDGPIIEEDHNSEIQEVGVAPVNGDRSAGKAVSHEHPRGFRAAGYVQEVSLHLPRGFSPAGTSGHVPRAHPDARPTPHPRASEQPPIVLETTRGPSVKTVSCNVVQIQDARPAAPPAAYGRSGDNAQAHLAGHEEEPASRSRTDGPVSKKRAQI